MGLFPDSMMKSTELSMEVIAGKFDYFFRQLHLLHLQTPSYAEHMALNIYSDVAGMKDEFIEKLMGYQGRKIRAYPASPIIDYTPALSVKVVTELKDFAQELMSYARMNGCPDIENLAQGLSGTAAKTLFLLTLT